MYTTTSLALSALIGLTAIGDIQLQRRTSLDHLICQSSQKPIFDPDDGSGRSFEQDKSRLDRFAKEMKVNSSADAYIIAFAGLVSYRNEVQNQVNCIRKYFITTHGISPSRLKLIDGGYSVEKSVKLFFVNPGESKPSAFPSVNREAVRITKAPKYPCGKPVPTSREKLIVVKRKSN